MKVYFDVTRTLLHHHRGNPGMDGIGRVNEAWGRKVTNWDPGTLVSGMSEEEVELLLKADPTLRWMTSENHIFGEGSCLQTLGLRANRATGILAKSRWLGYHAMVHESRKRIGPMISSHLKPGERAVYHNSGAFFVPYTLPPCCVPVVTLFDIIPFIFLDTYPPKVRRYFKKNLHLLASAGGHVIVNSYDTKHYLVCLLDFPAERIHVVPLGSDPPTLPPIAGSYAETQPPSGILCVASSAQRRKNLETAVRAFARFTSAISEEVMLTVTGRDTEGFQERSDEILRGSPGRVHCRGVVSDHELELLYRTSKIGLYPSLYEGFGLPVLEYMHRGVPVVCGNKTSLAEVAGDAALTVDPLDANAMADALLDLWSDENQRNRLIRAGKERAETFSWDRSFDVLREVYEKILSGS